MIELNLVRHGETEWNEMRLKRINNEISCEEYLEWKLHFEI